MEEARSSDTVFRSATVSGDLWLVAVPRCCFSLASVRVTRGVIQFFFEYQGNKVQAGCKCRRGMSQQIWG